MSIPLQNLTIKPDPIKFHPDWIRPQMAEDCNAIGKAIAHALNVEMATGLHNHSTPSEFLTHVFRKMEKIGETFRYMFTENVDEDGLMKFYDWTIVIYKGSSGASVDIELNDKSTISAISVKFSGVSFN